MCQCEPCMTLFIMSFQSKLYNSDNTGLHKITKNENIRWIITLLNKVYYHPISQCSKILVYLIHWVCILEDRQCDIYTNDPPMKHCDTLSTCLPRDKVIQPMINTFTLNLYLSLVVFTIKAHLNMQLRAIIVNIFCYLIRRCIKF